MDVDYDEYDGLTLTVPEEDPMDSRIYVKSTLAPSPIVKNIYPSFKVSMKKTIRSIRNLSFQDESDQYLSLRDADSQSAVFDDDDDSLLLEVGPELAKQSTDTCDVDVDPSLEDYVDVNLIVRTTSLLINNVPFNLASSIRDSCLVGGTKNSGNNEDGLLISLKSGFLMLIKLFYVPRTFTDRSSDESIRDKNVCRVFKPFAVQWWDVSVNAPNPSPTSSLTSIGHTLHSHVSGQAVVATAANGVFRIHNLDYSKAADAGIIFKPHYNVNVGGIIMQAAFGRPIENRVVDDHVMFLVLLFNDNNRLELCLYEWSTSEPIFKYLDVTRLPLKNDFELPIFTVPLKSGSFLFVGRKSLSVITMHNIKSGEYDSVKFPYSGSFPTSYYIYPLEDSFHDTIFISADDGVIHKVEIDRGEVVSIKPEVRVRYSLSKFVIKPAGDDNDDYLYHLIYASSTGLNQEIFVHASGNSSNYNYTDTVDRYGNWCPVKDVQIIDSYNSGSNSNHSSQELWCLSGCGKETRIARVTSGYSAASYGYTPSATKLESLFFFSLNNTPYLACANPFDSKLLEITPLENSEFTNIEEAAFITDSTTLSMDSVSSHVALQVTTNTIALTTISSFLLCLTLENDPIIYSHFNNEFLTLAYHEVQDVDSQSSVEIFQLQIPDIDDDTKMTMDDVFKRYALLKVESHVSMAKLLFLDSEMVLIVGSFDGNILIYGFNETPELYIKQEYHLLELCDTEDNNLVPHDVILVENTLLIGTKDGYLFYFHLGDASVNYSLTFDNCLVIGEMQVLFQQAIQDKFVVFVVCNSVWAIDFSQGFGPYNVTFSDNISNIKCLVPIPEIGENGEINSTGDKLSFVCFKARGLYSCELTPFKSHHVASFKLNEDAFKFIYLPHLRVFFILTRSTDKRKRMIFFDRKIERVVPHDLYGSKLKMFDEGASFLDDNEVPSSVSIWHLEHYGRTSKKILLGTDIKSDLGQRSGNFRVLDISKTSDQDNRLRFRVAERWKLHHNLGPINHIIQIEHDLLIADTKLIYATTYDVTTKRIKPLSHLLSLPSDVTSITVSEPNNVTITTNQDSLYQFKYDASSGFSLISTDFRYNALVNHATVNSKVIAGDKLHSDIIIMTSNKQLLTHSDSIKGTGIPRVFSANFCVKWCKDHLFSDGIVAINVNGQITFIKELAKDSDQLNQLKHHFELPGERKGLEFSEADNWDFPFNNKVTGKGLRSINRHYFRDKQKGAAIIDFDLDEVSRLGQLGISL